MLGTSRCAGGIPPQERGNREASTVSNFSRILILCNSVRSVSVARDTQTARLPSSKPLLRSTCAADPRCFGAARPLDAGRNGVRRQFSSAAHRRRAAQRPVASTYFHDHSSLVSVHPFTEDRIPGELQAATAQAESEEPERSTTIPGPPQQSSVRLFHCKTKVRRSGPGVQIFHRSSCRHGAVTSAGPDRGSGGRRAAGPGERYGHERNSVLPACPATPTLPPGRPAPGKPMTPDCVEHSWIGPCRRSATCCVNDVPTEPW